MMEFDYYFFSLVFLENYIKNQSSEQGMIWMNLPERYRTDNAKFVILPIQYEKALTYGTGASLGSQEIIKASEHLEYYDDQFDCEPFEQGIKVLEPLSLNDSSPEEMVKTVSETIQNIPYEKFILGLGGDHAATIGIVKGLEQMHSDFSVIQFDAHADFRDSWNGSSLNHACVAKQISRKHSLLLVGVRSMDVDEKRQMDESSKVHLISRYDFSMEKIKEILPKLRPKVFITIDVDVFDPSCIRNTGTPEPGGLRWEEVIDALQLIFQEKEVIGADIVEFAPNDHFDAEAYSLAKLGYKMMGLKEKYGK
ncbi:agmatinase [Candidatus Woesearchaeota archaeon]|nr:agmatinase [Candidatus Woesearchaeota archaeon]